MHAGVVWFGVVWGTNQLMLSARVFTAPHLHLKLYGPHNTGNGGGGGVCACVCVSKYV